jgi:sulfate transport system permease protein
MTPAATSPPGRASAFRVIPGFNLSLGFTVFYLSLIVLLPLAAVFLKTFGMTWEAFWSAVSSERVVASYRLTFGAALIGALLNVLFGGIVAWVLVRYEFPGKKIIDALVDLPFALPTAVAGIALTALYSSNGWLERYLEPLGIKVAFTPLGIIVALTFIGLPFVVRTVQRCCRTPHANTKKPLPASARHVRERQVSFVFQYYALFKRLRVFVNESAQQPVDASL